MSILTASLDDIVFEGRNRAYGAYELRRDYQRRLTLAGVLTLAICGLLFVSWLVWPTAQLKAETKHDVKLDFADVDVTPPVAIEKPKLAVLAPPRAPRQAAAPVAPTLPTQIAPDELVKPAFLPPTETTFTDGAVGSAAPGTGNELATGPSAPGGSATESTAAAPAEAGPVMFVEKMPEFMGGQAALMRYLRDHLRYPSQALHDQIEGRVFMSFVVRADGTIAEATVLKGLGYGLDEESLRVVRQMPAWTSGYQAQHAVAVRFTLPITFKIQ